VPNSKIATANEDFMLFQMCTRTLLGNAGSGAYFCSNTRIAEARAHAVCGAEQRAKE
jgi:hypothetical protein